MSESEQQRDQRIEELEGEVQRLQQQLEEALAEIERLKEALGAALRGGKRQATPFSKGYSIGALASVGGPWLRLRSPAAAAPRPPNGASWMWSVGTVFSTPQGSSP